MTTADTTGRLDRLDRWAHAVNTKLDRLTAAEHLVDDHREALRHHAAALHALEASIANLQAVIENHETGLAVLGRIALNKSDLQLDE